MFTLIKPCIAISLLSAGILPAAAAVARVPLSWGFDHPQDSARTKVWWFHGETVGTREGITADLEAFKRQGVGGVVYYEQVHGDGAGASRVFSREWWDELIFSSKEARRLGLSFECNASNGYVAGGKWITPDRSMQRLLHTELVADGGGDVNVVMPMVKSPGNWHRDVALIAVPYDEALLGDSRGVFSADSVLTLTDPSHPAHIDIDFGREVAARSITYTTGGRGKARTSSMQVPLTYFTLSPDMPPVDPHSFSGCGFRELPPIGELLASSDGKTYRKVCTLRPKYKNFGGVKEQTVAFPTVRGRFFRIVLHDWGTGNKADDRLTFGKVVISSRAQVDAWQEKASLVSEFIGAERTPRYADSDLADFSNAIDITHTMDDSGNVTWPNAPKGRWLLLRFFSVSTGGRTKHGRKDALGLECDKLSREGARLQWNSYVKPVIDSIRANGGLLTGICMDSHEAGPQNWTEAFGQEFMARRGYSMGGYLPVMAGFVVGSADRSARFLGDVRQTINELVAECYFGEFNRLCRSEGLTLTAQAVGGALCMACDAISVKRFVDKPQAEFWGYQTEGNYDIKDCSSAAHVYGKQIASGEAFTDITYRHSLADVKNLADYAYAFGINELVVCASAYQPWVRKGNQPLRINTANGRQYVLNRLNSLWPLSREFWDYQARCSWMLRQGKPVSDFCLYLGDDVPMRTMTHRLPGFPPGYDFDAFTTDALLSRMSVSGGRIVLPDGVSYSMMVLPEGVRVSGEARTKIDELRRLGAAVFEQQAGGMSLAEASGSAGLVPDVDFPAGANLYFCHRRTQSEDIYFLNNHSDEPVDGNFVFNVAADSAEIWDAVTGTKTAVEVRQAGGRTSVGLKMAPRESFFIVFGDGGRRAVPSVARGGAGAADTVCHAIDCKWTVTFDAGMGGPPEPVAIDSLADWTKSPDPRIKYYSGTALCSGEFWLDSLAEGAVGRLTLPLLNSAAEVIVNGRSAGVVWCSPWSVDVTSLLRKGRNTITLRVCNSLWNRLVGDARSPEGSRITWQTAQLAGPGSSLVPSGVGGRPVLSVISGKR